MRPTFDALEPPLPAVCRASPSPRLVAEAEVVRRNGYQVRPGLLSGITEYAPDAEEGRRSA